MKKLLSSIVALAMTFGALPVASLGASAMSSDGTTSFDSAYIYSCDPYIILGEETTWNVVIEGDTAPAECTVIVAYQSDLSQSESGSAWSGVDYFTLDVSDSEFTYTFEDEGRYFFQLDIEDKNGETLTIQSAIYEAYAQSDETNSSTVPGKINSIVNSLITDGMSDYNRALVLHDWLIYNANYDYTYERHAASGVLIDGIGVCESYARAYSMLLAAAGIDSMIVTGEAGQDADQSTWGAHAWNLVKLGGDWYHIDCTWDDPGKGGYENHKYFCVDDATMSVDHKWSRSDLVLDDYGPVAPDADGGDLKLDNPIADYDFEFSTIEEFEEKFDEQVAKGYRKKKITGLYVGEGTASDFYDGDLASWIKPKLQELYNQGLASSASRSFSGSTVSFNVNWNDPVDYIRITEEETYASIGSATTIIPAEFEMNSGNFVWKSSDPSVATVSYKYDENADNKLVAYVTGVSEGTAVITVTPADGGPSEKFTVTVLPALYDDFAVDMTSSDSELTLDWQTIPGVTEYRVIEMISGEKNILATVSDSEATVTSSENATGAEQKIFVEAVREVGDETVLSYTSEDKVIEEGDYVFAGGSVAIDKKIGVSFYMDINAPIEDNAYMLFTMADGSTREVAVSDARIDTTVSEGEQLYVFTCDVNTKEMSDIIKAQIINGDDKSRVFEYSVKEYADDMLAAKEGTYSDETIALVKAMLNYGGYAQQYLGYNTDNLANADLADKDVSSVTADMLADYKVYTKTLEGVGTFSGTSLSLKSNIILNVYFQPEQGVNAEDLVFEVNGVAVTAEKKGSYLVVSYEFPRFADLDTELPFTVSLASDESKTLTFECSALSYCYSVLYNGNYSSALENAVKAIYIYYDTALRYVSSQN